jgi:hypothetical protein
MGVDPAMSIESVLRAHERELLDLPNVTNVGIGHEGGREVILVLVSPAGIEAVSDGTTTIPNMLESFDVVVRPQLQIGGGRSGG